MDKTDEMDQVYDALVHWADAVIVATPIRWGTASSLYFKMAERLNCVQNAQTIADKVLIRDKVAGFIIVGGQDNVQMVAGQMLGSSPNWDSYSRSFPISPIRVAGRTRIWRRTSLSSASRRSSPKAPRNWRSAVWR